MITLQVPIYYGGFKGQERLLINGQWANVRPRVSQFFGETLQDYSRYGLPSHNGEDLITLYDDPILAMHDGIVLRDEPSVSGGNWIWLWGEGFITVYMHNHLLRVKKGEVVKAGEAIALSDTTGNSTGNHVHIGLYKADAKGNIVRDNPWEGAMPIFNNPNIILKDTIMTLTREEIVNQYILTRRYYPSDEEVSYWTGKELLAMQKVMMKDDRDLLDA
jgi:murein DD-endopeptidase MepM/ murein hydrolase activator NlpD